jgi:Tfp pilus assembly protein PilO
MALTSREQKIMYLAVAAIVFLIFNAYVLEPILDKRAQAGQTREALQAKVDQSLTTLKRNKKLQKQWAEMKQSGLDSDVQKAEAMVFRYLEESSNRSGLELGSVQPDRLISEKQLGEIEFILSGTGSMRSVTQFLWSLETATIPLKIKSYQLGSKNEMAQVMTIQVELSTVYVKDKPIKEKES